jgi:hypothetical protein
MKLDLSTLGLQHCRIDAAGRGMKRKAESGLIKVVVALMPGIPAPHGAAVSHQMEHLN